MRLGLLLGLVLLLSLGGAVELLAAPLYSPRPSGTEPPGGPRPSDALPQPGNFGRTPEGGLGYTDAYGNTITNKPQEPVARKRLPGGAYGRKDQDSSLEFCAFCGLVALVF